jgi:hypothetical protein
MRIVRFIPFVNIISCIRYSSSSLLSTKKICRDCKFFIANNNECGKHPNVDLVTGKVTYNYALSLRTDEKHCGKEGKYFEKNHFKFITVPYYFMKEWGFVVFLFGLLFTSAMASIIITTNK